MGPDHESDTGMQTKNHIFKVTAGATLISEAIIQVKIYEFNWKLDQARQQVDLCLAQEYPLYLVLTAGKRFTCWTLL